ncbi:MAG: tetratricopeptide repeat protein [Proteiniphilum sp.]|jgi:tetratricopeptide (TPR) repeat protein|nr:tetratricopeptide repeat protein [Proteiniphilum sp.]
MKLLHHLFIVLILFFCSHGVLLAQETTDTVFEKTAETGSPSSGTLTESLSASAAAAYRQQDYKRSAELYETLVSQSIESDMVSSEIYYNLGNAYFRDNQLGKAILNYERALLLDPGDGDIRHNLRFARNRTEDRIDAAGNLFFTNWFMAVRNIYSSNRWAAIGIVLFLLLLVCVAVFLFVRYLWARKTAFYCGIVLFLLVIVTNIFAFSQKRERLERESAIVMTGAVMVKASPDQNSNQLFELHEGTKVKIRNSDSNWYEIEIANGSVGWLSQETVEII